MRALPVILAASLLSGCLLGSGFSLCRGRDEALLALRPDVDADAVRAAFRNDGWTLGDPGDPSYQILRSTRVWNGTLNLSAEAWRTSSQDAGGNETSWTAVRIEGSATAPRAYNFSVETIEAPLLDKLRGLGLADLHGSPVTPSTTRGPSSWSCIHGD